MTKNKNQITPHKHDRPCVDQFLRINNHKLLHNTTFRYYSFIHK